MSPRRFVVQLAATPFARQRQPERIARSAAFLLVAVLTLAAVGRCAPPNVILIVCDNLGYGDVGCYGSTLHRTPSLDRMAAEGLRLTSFYVSSGVCTPSRASLMTGCYPRRVNLHVSDTGGWVLQPVARKGLHPAEVTIADLLQTGGYRTAIIGKWHLGDQPPFLPTRQGFSEFFGIPYSDDMTAREGRSWPPLPLMRDDTVVEAPADRNTLTKRYTAEAIRFIERHQHQPFFLYLPHAMPGSTRTPFASERFRGKSLNGPYGDSIEELDWSTGEILSALQRLELEQKTLVVWTSDNGAPRRNPPQGSNAPLKGWGYDCSEGAMRVPCLVRWPGHVPAGAVSDELVTSMDLYPTFAELAGVSLPPNTLIDGHSVWSLLSGHPDTRSPHEAFYFYFMDQLQAVRAGDWKLYLPLAGKYVNGRRERAPCTAELYDLSQDPGETTNIAGSHPDVVDRLRTLAERARRDLGDEDQPGAHQREAGLVENATPRLQPPAAPGR